MPGGDGTGPTGEGSGTGNQEGGCVKEKNTGRHCRRTVMHNKSIFQQTQGIIAFVRKILTSLSTKEV